MTGLPAYPPDGGGSLSSEVVLSQAHLVSLPSKHCPSIISANKNKLVAALSAMTAVWLLTA
jgi:hypothetical protein